MFFFFFYPPNTSNNWKIQIISEIVPSRHNLSNAIKSEDYLVLIGRSLRLTLTEFHKKKKKNQTIIEIIGV